LWWCTSAKSTSIMCLCSLLLCVLLINP
jgi:hypothetical protein